MDHQAEAAPTTQSVTAELTFFVDNGEPPVNHVTEKGLERGGEYRKHALNLRDGRAVRDSLSLNREGFELWQHDTMMTDFFDPEEVERVYDREIVALVKQATGAKRVFVFDHTIRVENEDRRGEKQVREPVLFVHNDYTHQSGPQRVRDLLPADEAEDLLTRRFNIINIWRSIAGPVQTTPLAVCDAQTIGADQLITAERRTKDRVGHTQAMTFSDDNRWYYFSDMRRDEAMLLKTYESDEQNHGGPSGHSAFTNPTAPADAAPRESIETRVFAFFD
ncbi:MAG: methyltransferase [Alphaproteobacteria bacterium]|nr:methyltransferase [Alphaproteobacteria bacterium]